MFHGNAFGVPAEIVSFLTILIGGPVTALIWALAIFNGSFAQKGLRVRLPLFLLSTAVSAHIAYLIIRELIPYRWTDISFGGVPLQALFYLVLWTLSLASLVTCVIVSNKQNAGRMRIPLKSGSVTLIVINILGIFLFILGLRIFLFILGLLGMPLH